MSSLDIQFRVEKSLKKSINTAEIRIYNLSQQSRNTLETEPSWRNADKTIPVTLDVGYGDELHTLFKGDLSDVFSRKDPPDWITTVSSGDGEKASATGRATRGFRGDVDVVEVSKELVKALGVGIGNVVDQVRKANGGRFGSIGRAFAKGFTASGSATKQLEKFLSGLGLEYSIQDGEVQALPKGKGLAGEAVLLTPDTGLLGSPERINDGKVRVRCLLQGNLLPGREIRVVSEAATGSWTIESGVYTGDTSAGASTWYADLIGRPLG